MIVESFEKAQERDMVFSGLDVRTPVCKLAAAGKRTYKSESVGVGGK